MTDLIVILILMVLVGGAIYYIYKEKKKGSRCIGCSAAGSCGAKTCNCAKPVDNTQKEASLK